MTYEDNIILKLSVVIDKWFQNGNWSKYRWNRRFDSRSGAISRTTSSAKLNDIIR